VPITASLADAVTLLLGEAPKQRARIAVLASGNGTNLQAVLDHFAALGPGRSGDVVVVASNRADAHALERARTAGIAAEAFDASDATSLVNVLERYRVDIVSLAGYLKLVPAEVVDRFRGRIINVHPGPLPRFGGPGMYGTRVHAAVLAAGASGTCVTVHLVDERYDSGATLAVWPVPVQPGDTPQLLAARVLDAEHIIYPRILDALAAAVVRGSVLRSD
jgi:formyltetrahydrofolate-dependent phosphoribosylglycinamide formyltransferase